MKVRDIIKIIVQEGWFVVRRKEGERNVIKVKFSIWNTDVNPMGK